MEIRELRADEHEEAGRITADAYREFFDIHGQDGDPEYLRRIGDVPGRAGRTTILVAAADDAIVGTLTLELNARIGDKSEPLAPGEAHIRMLGVLPAARARGTGRALMRAAEERARAAGRTFVTLNTTHRMQAAQAMYASLGYERGEDEILPDGFVLLSFRKNL